MLRRHALFDALDCHFRPTGAHGWRAWPAAFHDPQGAAAARFAAENPDEIAAYSSRGPTTTYLLSGASISSTMEHDTPIITATAGCSTKVGLNGYFVNPFYGTSAAAPHIAGIAALYFDEHPNDTRSDFISALTDYASSIGDNSGGTGIIPMDLEKPMHSLQSPKKP